MKIRITDLDKVDDIHDIEYNDRRRKKEIERTKKEKTNASKKPKPDTTKE